MAPIAAAVHGFLMSGCRVSGGMIRMHIRPIQYTMLTAMLIAINPIKVFTIITIIFI
jgi:hypothetical protein